MFICGDQFADFMVISGTLFVSDGLAVAAVVSRFLDLPANRHVGLFLGSRYYALLKLA